MDKNILQDILKLMEQSRYKYLIIRELLILYIQLLMYGKELLFKDKQMLNVHLAFYMEL